MADGDYFNVATDKHNQVGHAFDNHIIRKQERSPVTSPTWPGPFSRSPSNGAHRQFNNILDKHVRAPDVSSSPKLSSTFSEFRISNKSLTSGVAMNMVGECDSRVRDPKTGESSFSLESTKPRGVSTLNTSELLEMLKSKGGEEIIILDLRNASSHSRARLRGSISISTPVTLLKRTSYTIEKIANQLQPTDAERLKMWYTRTHVLIYDADSFNVGPGTVLNQFAQKFSNATFEGQICTIIGGFAAITRDMQDLIEYHSALEDSMSSVSQQSSPHIRASGAIPKPSSSGNLGELILPSQQEVVNPFFNNIRQNQDLIGGVGEPIALQVPQCTEDIRARLPRWLRLLAYRNDGPRLIAERFLKIEQEEQERMQRVLQSGSCARNNQAEERHSIAAGVERGDKNRYNNIWPFENSRVRLQDLTNTTSDYINANYLHLRDTETYYIATQGPLPGTTKDFWQMIWENDVRIVVMLTKTTEGGQNKCHSYWDDVSMMAPYKLDAQDCDGKTTLHDTVSDVPAVRRFRLTDTSKPLASSREIVHIQFTDWPDLHIIKPDAILGLIREVRIAQSGADVPIVKRRKSVSATTPQGRVGRPVLSHCSAGCGRTGVFCTIDTVLPLVRKQLENAADAMQPDIDLVEHVVRGFRDQRLSIVQTLRQYVLCYDAVLQYSIDRLSCT